MPLSKVFQKVLSVTLSIAFMTWQSGFALATDVSNWDDLRTGIATTPGDYNVATALTADDAPNGTLSVDADGSTVTGAKLTQNSTNDTLIDVASGVSFESLVGYESVEIRSDKESSLRFGAIISDYNPKNNYKYGMIIVPSSYLENVDGDYINVFSNNNIDVINLSCDVNYGEFNSSGLTKFYIQASITNIKYENINKKFTAIAYISDYLGNVTYLKLQETSLSYAASKEIVDANRDSEKYEKLLDYCNAGINLSNNVAEENKFDNTDFTIMLENKLSVDLSLEKNIDIKQNYNIDYYLSYESADEEIVTVDENGCLYGCKGGTTSVTVKCLYFVTDIEVTVNFFVIFE